MTIFLLILFGFIGGILGGMGMGGGTLLIPMLTLFLGVGQKMAQGINLFAFLPMAIFALIIHFKNKMIVLKGLWWVIIPGVIASTGFAFLASLTDPDVLKTCFGAFLIFIAIYETILIVKDFKKSKKTVDKKK